MQWRMKAGSPLAKNSNVFFTLRVMAFFAPSLTFLRLQLEAFVAVLSLDFCTFAQRFLGTVRRLFQSGNLVFLCRNWDRDQDWGCFYHFSLPRLEQETSDQV